MTDGAVATGRRKAGALAGTVLVVAGTVALAVPAAAAGQSHGHLACTQVPTARINATLGTKLTAVKQLRNGSVTVCNYAQGALTDKVTVRYQTGMNAASFLATETGFTSHNEPVTAIPGFGSKAFTSTIGGGVYARNSLSALKGSTDVLISASVPLGNVEALMHRILATL
jgi:hypothetical protein